MNIFYYMLNKCIDIFKVTGDLYGYQVSWYDVFIFCFGLYWLRRMVWTLIGDDD